MHYENVVHQFRNTLSLDIIVKLNFKAHKTSPDKLNLRTGDRSIPSTETVCLTYQTPNQSKEYKASALKCFGSRDRRLAHVALRTGAFLFLLVLGIYSIPYCPQAMSDRSLINKYIKTRIQSSSVRDWTGRICRI